MSLFSGTSDSGDSALNYSAPPGATLRRIIKRTVMPPPVEPVRNPYTAYSSSQVVKWQPAFGRFGKHAYSRELKKPRKPVRDGANLSNGFKLIWAVQSHWQKYSYFLPTQITGLFVAIPPRERGVS